MREQDVWRIGEAAGQQAPQALQRLVRPGWTGSARRRATPSGRVRARDRIRALAADRGVRRGGALGPALAELCAKDLLQQVAGQPEPVYRFRHALIQEATYNGLLRAERRLLHGRAAWALEAASRGREEEVAAVLGPHFAAAGETARALRYFEMAGDHATAAFANDEAISRSAPPWRSRPRSARRLRR